MTFEKMVNAHYHFLHKLHSMEVAEEFLNDAHELKKALDGGFELTEKQVKLKDYLTALYKETA